MPVLIGKEGPHERDANGNLATGATGGYDGKGAYNVDQIGAAKAKVAANTGAGQPGLGSMQGVREQQLYGSASSLRGDQSVAERIQQQENNFFYGGSQAAAGNAINAARTNMSPYTTALQGYGQTYADQLAGAGGRMAAGSQNYFNGDVQGQTGVYGNAHLLQNLAMQGPGPSVAQANLNANTAAAMRQQLAMAGSGRGAGGGAAAFRQAGMNQAQIQGAANAQASVLQAQEDQAWRQHQAALLGQSGALYATGRQGDMTAVGATQAQQGLNDQYALGMGQLANQSQVAGGTLQQGTEGLAHNINMGALGGTMGYEGQLAQLYGINKGVEIQKDQLDAQQDGAMWSAAGTAAAMGLMAMSDIRAKEAIQPAGESALPLPTPLDEEKRRARMMAYGQMGGQLGGSLGLALSDQRAKTDVRPATPRSLATELEALSTVRNAPGYSYRYKDPARHGEGQHFGPMAQDLAKTPAGRSTLSRTPDGKLAVDTGRLALVNTAATSGLATELDALRAEVKRLRGEKG